MTAWLKRLLRGWVLTHDEQELLADAPRALFRRKLLQRLVRWDQLEVIEALEQPDRFMPDEPLTKGDAEAWGQAILSPIGRKVDVAMINLAQQQAVRAVHAAPADIQRMAGYAAGFRSAWDIAKALSTIGGAETAKPEDGADKGASGLEHARP